MTQLVPRAVALVAKDNHIAEWTVRPLTMNTSDDGILPSAKHSPPFSSGCSRWGMCVVRPICRMTVIIFLDDAR